MAKSSHFMDNLHIAVQKKLEIVNKQLNYGETGHRAESIRRQTRKSLSPHRKTVTFDASATIKAKQDEENGEKEAEWQR